MRNRCCDRSGMNGLIMFQNIWLSIVIRVDQNGVLGAPDAMKRDCGRCTHKIAGALMT